MTEWARKEAEAKAFEVLQDCVSHDPGAKQKIIVKALLAAHAAGREEGIEQSAKEIKNLMIIREIPPLTVYEQNRNEALGGAFNTIRSLMSAKGKGE